MFECDAKLSADGVPFLMHDATLDRTTNGRGVGGQQPWSALSQLDAGGWHSRSFAGEPLPTLENLARFCLANDYLLNIEIKPTPGTERETGEVVAREAARLWQGAAIPPLLTSFQVDSLKGAAATQPELPRGLLLDTLWNGWLETALDLGCEPSSATTRCGTPPPSSRCTARACDSLSYTVNDDWAAQRLIALGTDGIITDRVDLFSPAG
jgi:glycerophosphoryl diester phosphodiesterase